MTSREQSSSCGESDFNVCGRNPRLSATSGAESLAKLQSDNKLSKQLIDLLNRRHEECRLYIKVLKHSNTKLMKRLNETDNTLNNLEEINCENNLFKLDKQIESLYQQIFYSSNKSSVQTQTTGEPIERTILKWNNSKTNDNNNSQPSGKFRCEYFGCNLWFPRKDQMETHLRLHNSMQEAISYEQTFDDNFNDKNKNIANNKSINESIIFVPQMELEVIEFSNNSEHNNAIDSLSFANSASDDSNSQNRNEKSQIGCDICGKRFSKHYIQSHRRSHTGVKPYKCSYAECERTFTQTSSRNYHEKTYHRSDKYSLKCYFTNCQKTFGRQIDLQKHLNVHTGSGGGGPALALQFNPGTHLLQPVTFDQQIIKVIKTRKLRRVPHRSGKHACAHCGKTFAHKVALRQHEVIHGSKQFVCTFTDCKYASYWKQNLSLHLRRHHNQEGDLSLIAVP